MKRILRFFLLVLACFLLSGCTNKISQDDYDLIKIENEKLQIDIDSLKSENTKLNSKLEELQKSYDTLSDENETNKSLASEYMKLYMNSSVSTQDIVTEAWGTATFGDDTKFVRIDQNTIQYNAIINEISKENIISVFSSFKKFAGALGPAMEAENTKYTYIKVIDKNSLPVFELFIDISNGSNNSRVEFLMNEFYDDLVKNAVNEVY
jgi:outer membrane murein-binding lipoprotein Lpp